MLKIIDHSNAKHHADILHAIFRFRHRIFVKERGWTAFEKADGYEQDDYDNENTIHVASLNDNQELIGYFRLYPTTRPYMISESFSHMLIGQPIGRGDLFEVSRLALDPLARTPPFYLEMLAGFMEVGLLYNANALLSLTPTARFSIARRAGLEIEPQGPPHLIDDVLHSVIRMKVNRASLSRINDGRGVHHSCLMHPLPAITTAA